MAEKIQLWYCEACQIEGAVRLDPVQDVYGAIFKLEDAHRQANQLCEENNTLTKVRIRAPQCSDAEWAEVTKDRKDIAFPR